MKLRNHDQILSSLLSGKGRREKFRQKLLANKDENWLLSLFLHSCAKLNAKEQLSDLEMMVIQPFQRLALNDLLKKHGETYAKMTVVQRKQFFPEKFAALDIKSSFTLSDLKKEAPSFTSRALAVPNTINVDVHAVHQGKIDLKGLALPSKETIQQSGGKTLYAIDTSDAGRGLSASKYTIKADSFRCGDESSWDWLGSDEPYWIFNSFFNGKTTTSRSRVFGGVDSGDSRTFNASEGWIFGASTGQAFANNDPIGVHIQLWEHDYGDPNYIVKANEAAAAAAASILAVTGVAAWVGILVAAFAKLLGWLLSFLDDDLMGKATFVFSPSVIEGRIGPKPKDEVAVTSFIQSTHFSDGDADYDLKIKVSRVS